MGFCTDDLVRLKTDTPDINVVTCKHEYTKISMHIKIALLHTERQSDSKLQNDRRNRS